MTILEAILQADAARANDLEPALKLQWLSALDGQLQKELLEPRGLGDPAFSGYDDRTDLSRTQLLVPFPYDELYPQYLVMRTDLAHGELERYNNDALCFNRLYQSWAGWLARSHPAAGEAGLRF